MKSLLSLIFIWGAFVALSISAYGKSPTEPEFNLTDFKSRSVINSSHHILIAPDNNSIWGYSDLTGKWGSYDLSKSNSKLIGPMSGDTYTCYVTGNRIIAYSAHTGKWNSYDFPKDLKTEINPTLSTNLFAALVNDQMVGYSSNTGKWDSVKIDPTEVIYTKPSEAGFFQILDKGQRQKLSAQVPLVAKHVAGGIIGNKAYAFSNTGAKWKVIEFPVGQTPIVSVSNNTVEARSKNYLYMFSANENKWNGIKSIQNKDGTTSIERVK